MTYRELLEQKLINNGATKQQIESKIVDIMIATLALEKNPNLDEFVEIIKEDKKICEETKRRLRNREAELWDEKNAYKVKYDQVQEKEKTLQLLRDQIDECETAEARDRIRLAERFAESVERRGGITNGYERTAYIKSLGMILGTKCQNEEGES